jgi:hypothetical protein|tara:strand:- start:484 stop:678 length:195 start_codon:yes stop_codon:yes gene_type:complete
MNKEQKINKIMDLVVEKSPLSEEKLDTFEEVLSSLSDNHLNKLVAGIVFAEKPFSAPHKIWRIE